MSSHNQVEVNSVDQYVWREQRTKIYTRLQKLAESQGCDYIPVRQTISHEQKFCDEIMSSRKTKILTSCFGDIIPSMGTLVDLDKKCQSHGKKLWLLTDNLVDSTKYNFSNIDIRPVPQLLGPYASIRDQSDPVASHGRLFNCFIQRCESVRQSWFYHLWLENLLEKGYVSYLLLQMRGYSKLTGMDLFDAIHHSQGLDTLPKFQIAHEKLRTVVPYRNFEENFDLMTYINDSKYSVVLETFAVEDNHGAWCVTEKTLRSLQSNSISLLFCQKHCIKLLETLGLVIDSINYEWDSDDWISRQLKILEVLKKDSMTFDVALQKDRRDHNKHIINSWRKQYEQSNFFDFVADEIALS